MTGSIYKIYKTAINKQANKLNTVSKEGVQMANTYLKKCPSILSHEGNAD